MGLFGFVSRPGAGGPEARGSSDRRRSRIQTKTGGSATRRRSGNVSIVIIKRKGKPDELLYEPYR